MLINNVGNPLQEYLLNIDAGMVMVEEILNKYFPAEVVDGNLLYIRGTRLPIPVSNQKLRDKYSKLGIASNVPWHPCKAIPIMEDMLEYYQYHHTDHASLFESNPVMSSNRIYHLPSTITDTTIILTYVPDISDIDIATVANLFLDMYNKYVSVIYNEHPNSVYVMTANNNTYRLIRYEDVRVVRFNEIINLTQEGTWSV